MSSMQRLIIVSSFCMSDEAKPRHSYKNWRLFQDLFEVFLIVTSEISFIAKELMLLRNGSFPFVFQSVMGALHPLVPHWRLTYLHIVLVYYEES